MKPKTMVLMIVAVGCGLVASYMTSKLIADRGAGDQGEPRVKVLVAKKKLKALTNLNKPEELFIEKDLPLDVVPKKAVKGFEELKDKRLNKPMSEESIITTDDLISKDLIGMQATLPPGMRAIGLRVNPEGLAGGFVLPGARVDVVSVSNDGERVAQIILQDMLVLAVDLQSNHDPDKGTAMLGNTVTLAATPEEAQRLAFAGSGEMRLLLRGLGDSEKIQVRGTKRADMHKPLRGSSESQNGDAGTLAQGATPKIPELPPVPNDPPAPLADAEPAPEGPQLKTHKLTIHTGDQVHTQIFVQEKNGSWRYGATDRGNADGGEAPKQGKNANAKKPGWSRPAPQPPQPQDQPSADNQPRQQTLAEKLMQNSGLPPVNSGK